MAKNLKELKVSENIDYTVNEVWSAESQLCLLVLNNYNKLLNRLKLDKDKSLSIWLYNQDKPDGVCIELSVYSSCGEGVDTICLGISANEKMLEIRLSPDFFNISNKGYFSTPERASAFNIASKGLKEVLNMSEIDFIDTYGG